MDNRQRYAIINSHKKQLLKLYPALNEGSGIYIFTREKDGFKFAYIGQAKHLLSRLVQHLMGYKTRIDKSLIKRKLYTPTNTEGWKIQYFHCTEKELDDEERKAERYYADNGYQLYNKTIGGQDKGKVALGEYTERKGYRTGVDYGYEKCKKEIKVYFDKYLDVVIKDKPNKIKERKLEEFKQFLGV